MNNEKLIESLSSFAIQPTFTENFLKDFGPMANSKPQISFSEDGTVVDANISKLMTFDLSRPEDDEKATCWHCGEPEVCLPRVGAKDGGHVCTAQDVDFKNDIQPLVKFNGIAFDHGPLCKECKAKEATTTCGYCDPCDKAYWEIREAAKPYGRLSTKPDQVWNGMEWVPDSRPKFGQITKETTIEMFPDSKWAVKTEPDNYMSEEEVQKLKTAKETAAKFSKTVDDEWRAAEEEMARKKLIAAKIKELESLLEPDKADEKVPEGKSMMYAEEIKAKTKKFAAKNTEFMNWYGKHVSNADIEKDYLQAINWLSEKFVRAKNDEDRKDWEIVQEVFEENTRVFRDRVKAKLAEINAGVEVSNKPKQESVRFNGFLYLTIQIPDIWFEKLKSKGGKIDDKNARKFFDCRKIAPMPHKDETVQMNPELSVVKDKAFAEAYIQYDGVLNKVMHFINGPATDNIVFFNGALVEPLFPTVISKMQNAKQLGEETKLDAILGKLCVQLVPHVVVVEFVGASLNVQKDIMENRGYHLDKMGWLTTVCKSMGMIAAHKPAGGSAEK